MYTNMETVNLADFGLEGLDPAATQAVEAPTDLSAIFQAACQDEASALHLDDSQLVSRILAGAICYVQKVPMMPPIVVHLFRQR